MWTLLLRATLTWASPLSLPEAVAEARAQGPAAALVEQELAAERAAAWAASVGQSQAQLALLASPTWSEWTLQLPVGLLLPVRPAPLAAGRSLAEQRALGARVAVVGAVLGAYLDLARAQALEALAGRLEALARQAAAALRARAQAGELDPAEAALAQADAAAVLDQALQAGRARALAALRLEALLGRDPAGQVEAAGWPTLPDPPPIAPEQALSVAQAQAEQRAAAAARQQQRLNALPQLSALGGLELEGGAGAPLYGFTLSAPNPGATAQARQAAAEAQAAGLHLEQARLDAAVALAEARLELSRAEATLAAYDEVPAALALEAAEARARAGEWSAPEALATRALLAQALAGQVQAQHAVLAARWRLWELAGALPPELR